jgi:hypothetical protein
MLTASFVAQHFRPQGQMPSVAILVGKNTCKSIAARMTQNCVAGRATGAYARDCLRDMAESACVVVKQSLSF